MLMRYPAAVKRAYCSSVIPLSVMTCVKVSGPPCVARARRSVALTKFVGQYDTSWHYVFGVSIVAVLPVVILFMLIEKRLVGGLTAGSVK